MSSERSNTREFSIYRYDPTQGGEGRFDRFTLEVPDETCTTILDVLIRLQREQDPTLAFRYACRVNMCGSCGMVINGREGLACKTNVGDFPGAAAITIRPLNHFPVIKDLVVDMEPFFRHYEACLPFFEPKEASQEPAVIRPDSPERQAIGLATECIACGCCVSSCTMAHYHEAYAGPAPLNRAFTLLMDSRDGLHDARMERVLGLLLPLPHRVQLHRGLPEGDQLHPGDQVPPAPGGVRSLPPAGAGARSGRPPRPRGVTGNRARPRRDGGHEPPAVPVAPHGRDRRRFGRAGGRRSGIRLRGPFPAQPAAAVGRAWDRSTASRSGRSPPSARPTRRPTASTGSRS